LKVGYLPVSHHWTPSLYDDVGVSDDDTRFDMFRRGKVSIVGSDRDPVLLPRLLERIAPLVPTLLGIRLCLLQGGTRTGKDAPKCRHTEEGIRGCTVKGCSYREGMLLEYGAEHVSATMHEPCRAVSLYMPVQATATIHTWREGAELTFEYGPPAASACMATASLICEGGTQVNSGGTCGAVTFLGCTDVTTSNLNPPCYWPTALCVGTQWLDPLRTHTTVHGRDPLTKSPSACLVGSMTRSPETAAAPYCTC
jgi:hypothetical protein